MIEEELLLSSFPLWSWSRPHLFVPYFLCRNSQFGWALKEEEVIDLWITYLGYQPFLEMKAFKIYRLCNHSIKKVTPTLYNVIFHRQLQREKKGTSTSYTRLITKCLQFFKLPFYFKLSKEEQYFRRIEEQYLKTPVPRILTPLEKDHQSFLRPINCFRTNSRVRPKVPHYPLLSDSLPSLC